MTRRNFVLSFFALSASQAFSRSSTLGYQVKFLVDLKKHNENEFFALQSKYEDNQAIDKMSLEFERRGWLLGKRQFEKINDHLVWTYRFQSKEIFEKWESNLYALGMVQKNGRPYVIQREAKYVFA